MNIQKNHLTVYNPKIIHFCWFGPKDYSEDPLVSRCIASWKKFLPDYEIKLWNEKNSPMDHPFVRDAYNAKKWAFVSDYVRFWALYNEGGLYLDTDMEIMKPLDSFFNKAFVAFDDQGTPSCGIMFFEKNNHILSEILSIYNTINFDINSLASITSPQILSTVLKKHDLITYTNKDQVLEDIVVYNHKLFYPFSGQEKIHRNTDAYTIHYWNESWVSFPKMRKIFRRLHIMNIFKKILDIFKIREFLKGIFDKHNL